MLNVKRKRPEILNLFALTEEPVSKKRKIDPNNPFNIIDNAEGPESPITACRNEATQNEESFSFKSTKPFVFV